LKNSYLKIYFQELLVRSECNENPTGCILKIDIGLLPTIIINFVLPLISIIAQKLFFALTFSYSISKSYRFLYPETSAAEYSFHKNSGIQRFRPFSLLTFLTFKIRKSLKSVVSPLSKWQCHLYEISKKVEVLLQ